MFSGRGTNVSHPRERRAATKRDIADARAWLQTLGGAMGEAAARPDLLPDLRDQRRQSLDRIVSVLYHELREIAHRHLQARGRGSTLQTTALLHEAYLKLVDQSRAEWNDQVHFLALAAVAMRHVLVDRARERIALKRGGGHAPITLDDASSVNSDDAAGLLELHDALDRLAKLDARLAQVVECRFFGGMSEGEIAAALEVTVRTVQRDWSKARMLLRASLGA